MENKTCGECKHFDRVLGICDLTDDFSTVLSNTLACVDFEICLKPTNGDKIRQMSNEELAVMFRKGIDRCPPGECHDDGCIECWLAWLNTPADCVKQNGNHDTQADLCKADNTESEVKNV